MKTTILLRRLFFFTKTTTEFPKTSPVEIVQSIKGWFYHFSKKGYLKDSCEKQEKLKQGKTIENLSQIDSILFSEVLYGHSELLQESKPMEDLLEMIEIIKEDSNYPDYFNDEDIKNGIRKYSKKHNKKTKSLQ